MDHNLLYIFQKPPKKALKALFSDLYEGATIRSKGADTLVVEAPVDPLEPLDYHDLYALVQADFDLHIAMLVVVPQVMATFDEDLLLEYLPKVPAGYYEIEDFLLTLIKRQPKTIQPLKTQLFKTLGPELVDTALALADANMNASIAAKHHYMHRNTMLYRIDRIQEKTGINIKSFAGLSIFTQLYRH